MPEWDNASNYYFAFEPATPLGSAGLIIYPGAYVDPRAYAPAAHAVAAQGHLAVIVKMPSDLALFGYTRADRIISDYPAITSWVIAGHSLGGVGASAYIKANPAQVDGVIMWASYPSETYRIDTSGKKGMSIYGTLDGLVTLDEIELSYEHMPPYTRWLPIIGGNHTQFAWYDVSPYPVQPEDNIASITRQVQQAVIIDATTQFLDAFWLCSNDPQGDVENDNVCGDVDNCPSTPNGPGQGTCARSIGGIPSGTGIICTPGGMECPAGQTCQLDQEDINGNGIGDACECYADISGSAGNPDSKVDAFDLLRMKQQFNRTGCTPETCQADLNRDTKVDSFDLLIMKVQFNRTGCPLL